MVMLGQALRLGFLVYCNLSLFLSHLLSPSLFPSSFLLSFSLPFPLSPLFLSSLFASPYLISLPLTSPLPFSLSYYLASSLSPFLSSFSPSSPFFFSLSPPSPSLCPFLSPPFFSPSSLLHFFLLTLPLLTQLRDYSHLYYQGLSQGLPTCSGGDQTWTSHPHNMNPPTNISVHPFIGFLLNKDRPDLVVVVSERPVDLPGFPQAIYPTFQASPHIPERSKWSLLKQKLTPELHGASQRPSHCPFRISPGLWTMGECPCTDKIWNLALCHLN